MASSGEKSALEDAQREFDRQNEAANAQFVQTMRERAQQTDRPQATGSAVIDVFGWGLYAPDPHARNITRKVIGVGLAGLLSLGGLYLLLAQRAQKSQEADNGGEEEAEVEDSFDQL